MCKRRQFTAEFKARVALQELIDIKHRAEIGQEEVGCEAYGVEKH